MDRRAATFRATAQALVLMRLARSALPPAKIRTSL
jgi:hypothetical protein